MAGVLLRNTIIKFSPASIRFRPKTTYVVLLPETPPDTPEDNALLRTDDLPQFSELTPEKCWAGIGKLSLEYESGVWAVEENARNENEPKTFENLLEPLDCLDAPLNVAWSAVKTLYTVRNDIMPTQAYMKIHERARKARVHKFQSRPIYQACKEIYTKQEGLSEAQQRVVRKFLLEARLNGIELPPEQARTFNGTLKRLEHQKSLYLQKVTETTNNFVQHIRDPSIVRDFPLDLIKAMSLDKSRALEGPWAVTLDPQIYEGFMTHCPVQSLRFNVWRAYNVRASNHISKDVNNSLHIEEIRGARREQATILGYKDFAQMSMETKMAGSVDNVLSMITSLVAKAKGAQTRELESLQAFAESRGFDGELQIYDIPYWRNKERRAKLNYDEAHLSEYFPFEHVLVKMLELSASLFGVSYEEVPKEDVSTWHEDVRFFSVLDANDGSYLASFYLDPFQRPGAKLHTRVDSAWMLGTRSRSDVAGSTPVASLIFNFAPPLGDRPALLTFRDVNVLFQKFGHALQHLLTTVPYSEASGLTNIEWDAVDVCAHFFHNWLYEHSTLENISSHYESGMPLKGSSVEDLVASRSHLAAYDLCSALYLSHLDLALHTQKDFWQDIVRELWEKYRPFPMDKYDSHLCSQTSIIADVWTAAYYSHTWSQMVAADAFQAFKENEEAHDLQHIGGRFRDTFLSLGGGSHPSEVFRRFRGRDPSPEALLHLSGITGKVR